MRGARELPELIRVLRTGELARRHGLDEGDPAECPGSPSMKNPLLVPELRDMLAADRVNELRDFCSATSAEAAAEFLAALTTSELTQAVNLLEGPSRAAIFANLDDESRLSLIEALDRGTAAGLVADMPEQARTEFIERLSDDQKAELRALIQQAAPQDARPVLDTLAEVRRKPEPEEMTAEEIAGEVAEHLACFRIAEGRVHRLSRLERNCWVEIINPTRESLPLIAEHFEIPVDFLAASLDVDETARIEVDDGATLLIVKVPYFDESNVDILYMTVPIGFILVGGFTITICPKQPTVLQSFMKNQVRHPAGGHRFILQVIYRATLLYLQHLKQLNNTAAVIQKKLEQESRNQQLIKLFNIEKSLVYFTTSLKSNMLMLERLQRLRGFDLNEENRELLESIFTECKQAIEMANIYSDILSGMMDAFASVISNNLNIVMRLLTSITIIITIPVLVTGLFGMNVILPGDQHPHAFLAIIALCAVLCAGAVVFFRRRRWLEP
jgi:magnesium transporter